ncbi:hypothetical protein BD309DRAFT_868654 [Dichomitus squalens]|uniref:Uncharacterized protein n=1 Tax=Dichomitus squalens TaxID=114155 RepID=A0A4Q9MZY4_9APHY|nr:hypothetical protein BD311DRAFT_656054 [Dichomitus squalens]TBU41260.1 hypothetical protein BD309DRAFT_868654 [Dichomitus squalens]
MARTIRSGTAAHNTLSVIHGFLIMCLVDKGPHELRMYGTPDDGFLDGVDIWHAGKPSAREDSEPPGAVCGDRPLNGYYIERETKSHDDADGAEVARFGKTLVRLQKK